MLAVDTIARNAADPPESNAPAKREVFHGEEQNEITVPLDLIIRGTDVDLYEEILNKNLFRVFLRGKKLVLTDGSKTSVLEWKSTIRPDGPAIKTL